MRKPDSRVGAKRGERPQRDGSPPLDGLSGRPREPVKRPAAVVLLAPFEEVEVGLDLVVAKSSRLRAPGRGDKASGVSRSFSVPPGTGSDPSAPSRERTPWIAARARAWLGTWSRKSSENFTQ